ncbi:hypothetical protein M378DRAFT_173653, partial [Amanita muscaria Koide BX008]
MPTCRSAVNEESVKVEETDPSRLTWTPHNDLPSPEGLFTPVIAIESDEEAQMALTTLSKAPNVESRGDAPFIDPDSLDVVSEGAVTLGDETRQKITLEEVQNGKLTFHERRRVKKPPDKDLLNLDSSRNSLEAVDELE